MYGFLSTMWCFKILSTFIVCVFQRIHQTFFFTWFKNVCANFCFIEEKKQIQSKNKTLFRKRIDRCARIEFNSAFWDGDEAAILWSSHCVWILIHRQTQLIYFVSIYSFSKQKIQFFFFFKSNSRKKKLS